ncbi:hypothetical protein [Ruegeria sp. ANG-R]|uniref:hypothetical protein n=1 Tax=Ruegeria sp. ANG-R TaxID=1577903 RepID=UPI000A7863D3|nr:hypothetical protein [Ruegeria sp. ANG-R]
MARLYLVRLTEERPKTLFWISELVAGSAFVVLMLAVLFGPYLLGCVPKVEAEIVGALK